MFQFEVGSLFVPFAASVAEVAEQSVQVLLEFKGIFALNESEVGLMHLVHIIDTENA